MRTQVVLGLYGVWMLAVTAAFYAFPAGHLVLWSLLALSSAGAIGAGTVVHRPAHRFPWWLLAVGVTVFAAGDTTYNVLTTILGERNPFPSLADVFYLAVYPFAAAGLVLLIRHRTGGRDRGSLLDALSLTSALALLSWIFLISPYVNDQQLDWLERATSIAYPLGDVLILATSTRLAITSGGNRAAAMLGIGAVGLLGSDVVYGLGQLDGTWQIGSWYDLGWVVFYIAWGAAALHPSMATVAVPHQQPADGMSIRRIVLLMTVSLVAPGVLLADALNGTVEYGPMIAVSSIVLFLLVLARLAGVVARHREAIERERTLRAAGADLVSAAGPEDVARAVRAAVAQLVPPGAPHGAVLLADAGPGPEIRLPTAASRLCRFEDLDPVLAAEVPGFTTALLCPLVLADRPTAGPSMGLLVVAADEAVLITLRGAVEVLASQAALAVERVTLSREVIRRDSEAYFRTLVQNAHDVILIVDDAGRIGYASPSAQTVLGPGCVLGTSVADLLDRDDRAGAQRALLAARGGTGATVRGYGITRTDGRRIDVEVASRDLRDDPTIQGVVLTLRDVTEERRLQQELTHRAFHDPLTGLANRVLFGERVEQALATTARDGGMAGLLLVDLDDFKLVNDTMGHGTGDDLLIAVADQLTGALRPGDTAARLGGDEFAVLVEGVSAAAEVEEIASRVVDALCVPLDVAGGLTTSVSIGVATTCEATAPADMLRQADLALYDAKGAGKGRWRRYQQGLHLAAVDRLQVRAELERALVDGAFELRYQPVVELDCGRMVGVEALVRWRHPRRGLVPPGDFIPFAEESGLVVPLGAWVLDRALADHREWYRDRGTGTSITVSVNVSACQVRSPGFVDGLAAALARWEVPPESLVLEITETSLLADDAQVSADLAALRELGVGIAIDDFGTGYSSLDYIRLHTVDVLKIDRSFIGGMERSGRQAALVGSIVHLAQALGLEIVAEGVETTAQRDALQRAGCQLGQGHLYSVAVTAEEITARLRAGAASAGVDAAS
jgi:diguanylate cyclase (GGDEF)-like protein/PAS domain S-box-containing protein